MGSPAFSLWGWRSLCLPVVCTCDAVGSEELGWLLWLGNTPDLRRWRSLKKQAWLVGIRVLEWKELVHPLSSPFHRQLWLRRLAWLAWLGWGHNHKEVTKIGLDPRSPAPYTSLLSISRAPLFWFSPSWGLFSWWIQANTIPLTSQPSIVVGEHGQLSLSVQTAAQHCGVARAH